MNISIDKWQAKDHANSSNYAHNTNRGWGILFNQNVEYVRYRFAQFDIPEVWDKLKIMHYNGTTTWTHYSEPPLDPSLTVPFQVYRSSNHTGATWFEHSWETDNSVNGTGYRINGLSLNCLATPPPLDNTVYIMPNRPYDGYLLAENDVIWVWTTQPANIKMSLFVTVLDSADDFDLFASTNPSNKRPSYYSYDYRSIRGAGSNEMIVIPPPAQNTDIYISIGSYSGKGQFRFYANRHAGYPDTVYAKTDWMPSAAHRALIGNQMRKIAQTQYWATDGRHYMKEVHMHWNWPSGTPGHPYMLWSGFNSGPNKCVWDSACPYNPNHATFHPYNWCGTGCFPALDPGCTCIDTQASNQLFASGTAAHEIGHCYYDLCTDEYETSTACGHSVMANFWNESLNAVDYCDFTNGGKNPPAGYTGHGIWADNWPIMEAKYPSDPSYGGTPDPFFTTCSQADGDAPFPFTFWEHYH